MSGPFSYYVIHPAVSANASDDLGSFYHILEADTNALAALHSVNVFYDAAKVYATRTPIEVLVRPVDGSHKHAHMMFRIVSNPLKENGNVLYDWAVIPERNVADWMKRAKKVSKAEVAVIRSMYSGKRMMKPFIAAHMRLDPSFRPPYVGLVAPPSKPQSPSSSLLPLPPPSLKPSLLPSSRSKRIPGFVSSGLTTPIKLQPARELSPVSTPSSSSSSSLFDTVPINVPSELSTEPDNTLSPQASQRNRPTEPTTYYTVGLALASLASDTNTTIDTVATSAMLFESETVNPMVSAPNVIFESNREPMVSSSSPQTPSSQSSSTSTASTDIYFSQPSSTSSDSFENDAFDDAHLTAAFVVANRARQVWNDLVNNNSVEPNFADKKLLLEQAESHWIRAQEYADALAAPYRAKIDTALESWKVRHQETTSLVQTWKQSERDCDEATRAGTGSACEEHVQDNLDRLNAARSDEFAAHKRWLALHQHFEALIANK